MLRLFEKYFLFFTLDPPGAPSTPKIQGVTEDSVTLEWNPPKKDGGSPLFGYIVEKREKGDTKWTK